MYDSDGDRFGHCAEHIPNGRQLIAAKGYMASLANPLPVDELDPPSPSPRRHFDLGAACARILKDSPWRVALVASSSWSHAFLTRKHYYLYPDHAADQGWIAAPAVQAVQAEVEEQTRAA